MVFWVDVALVLTLSQPPARPAVLPVLYVTYAVLQVLDVQSTLQALSHGQTREANPMLGRVVGHPPALVAVKAASAVTTVLLTEYLWKKKGYRRTAVITLLVINGLTAVVVARNYRY
jgi:hypothetical protein